MNKNPFKLLAGLTLAALAVSSALPQLYGAPPQDSDRKSAANTGQNRSSSNKEKRQQRVRDKEVAENVSSRRERVSAASAQIDALVEAGYKKHAVTPNPPISDATFVRRIYLDIAGRIPTTRETESFLGSSEADKRSLLIDRLLDSEGYVSHFYNYWADILRINKGLGTGAAAGEAAYNLWVKNALRENKPYDNLVYDLVTAEGKIWENGAIGYYQRDRGMPLDNMSNTVRVFLGVRLECAQCHDHPFDKWTQMDYFKMAAFSHGMDTRRYETPNQKAFAQHQQMAGLDEVAESMAIKGLDAETIYEVARSRRSSAVEKLGLTRDEVAQIKSKVREAAADAKEDGRQLRKVISDLYNPIQYIAIHGQERDLKLPHDYQYNDAKPFEIIGPDTMFGGDVNRDDHESLIAAYGTWMTSSDNPTFTRVIANRLWMKVFGVGIIEPADELTVHTEISNPELMAYLEDLMRSENYDMKSFLRVLFNSASYQRGAFPGEIQTGVAYHFPGPALRRMSAEQIWDSLIAMAIPEADNYLPGVADRLASIEKSRLIYNALEGRPEKEYIAMVEEVAGSLEGVYEKQVELRTRYIAAREAKDEEKTRQLQGEIRELTRNTKQTIADIAYTDSGAETIDKRALLAGAGMMEMSAMSDSGSARPVITSRPKVEIPEAPESLSKDQRRRWKQDQSRAASNWSRATSKLMRASELPSPSPRGHFLREFGQSDREVIENASDSASVPQALALLNGPMTETLANPFAVLGAEIADASSPEETIDRIYLAMLSRPANERETSLLLPLFERDPKSAPAGIIWALLNTQQFLFIQ